MDRFEKVNGSSGWVRFLYYKSLLFWESFERLQKSEGRREYHFGGNVLGKSYVFTNTNVNCFEGGTPHFQEQPNIKYYSATPGYKQ